MNLLFKKVHLKASVPHLEKPVEKVFPGKAGDILLAQEEIQGLYPSLGKDLVIGLSKAPSVGVTGGVIYLIKKEDYQKIVSPDLSGGAYISSVSLPGLPGVNFLSLDVREHNKKVVENLFRSYFLLSLGASLLLALLLSGASFTEAFSALKREQGAIKTLRPKYEANISRYSDRIEELKKLDITDAAGSRSLQVTPLLHLISGAVGPAVMVTRVEKKGNSHEISGIGLSDRDILKFRSDLQLGGERAGITVKLKQTDSQGERRVAFEITLD